MPISPGAEPHMVALANQADAANRPRWIIIFTAVLVILCTTVAAAGTMRFLRARSAYTRVEAQLTQASALTTQIITARTAKPSLATLYPGAGLMYNHVVKACKQQWGLEGTASVPAAIATIDRVKHTALSLPGLGKANVKCSIRNQPLTTTLQFIETVLADEHMANAFISTFELEPTAGGWNAVIEFRRYEVEEDR